jgi:hypothetical protein
VDTVQSEYKKAAVKQKVYHDQIPTFPQQREQFTPRSARDSLNVRVWIVAHDSRDAGGNTQVESILAGGRCALESLTQQVLRLEGWWAASEQQPYYKIDNLELQVGTGVCIASQGGRWQLLGEGGEVLRATVAEGRRVVVHADDDRIQEVSHIVLAVRFNCMDFGKQCSGRGWDAGGEEVPQAEEGFVVMLEHGVVDFALSIAGQLCSFGRLASLRRAFPFPGHCRDGAERRVVFSVISGLRLSYFSRRAPSRGRATQTGTGTRECFTRRIAESPSAAFEKTGQPAASRANAASGRRQHRD